MTRSKKQQLRFHIQSDDYFATLATILDLIKQDSEKAIKIMNKIHHITQDQLENLKNDLLFLQKNYKIVKK